MAADAYDFGYSIGRIDAKGEILRTVLETNKTTLSVEEIAEIINSIKNE